MTNILANVLRETMMTRFMNDRTVEVPNIYSVEFLRFKFIIRQGIEKNILKFQSSINLFIEFISSHIHIYDPDFHP